MYAQSIHNKGAQLQDCFTFIDDTAIPICRLGLYPRAVYNEHERVNALKFQSIALPNNLIRNLSNTYEGMRHDSTMLNESQLLPDLQRVAWCNG